MIIPDSTTFDQRTLTLLLEHDPVVQRYRAFFALFDWSAVPDPPLEGTQSTCRQRSRYVEYKWLKVS
jgi:hypothetical protein